MKRSRLFYWCFYHILMSSVIYYCTDPQQRKTDLSNYRDDEKVVNGDVIYAFVFQQNISSTNQMLV